MARSKLDVETRAGRWWVAEESDRWGTYVKPARRDGQRGGDRRQDEKREKESGVEMEGKRRGGGRDGRAARWRDNT